MRVERKRARKMLNLLLVADHSIAEDVVEMSLQRETGDSALS